MFAYKLSVTFTFPRSLLCFYVCRYVCGASPPIGSFPSLQANHTRTHFQPAPPTRRPITPMYVRAEDQSRCSTGTRRGFAWSGRLSAPPLYEILLTAAIVIARFSVRAVSIAWNGERDTILLVVCRLQAAGSDRRNYYDQFSTSLLVYTSVHHPPSHRHMITDGLTLRDNVFSIGSIPLSPTSTTQLPNSSCAVSAELLVSYIHTASDSSIHLRFRAVLFTPAAPHVLFAHSSVQHHETRDLPCPWRM